MEERATLNKQMNCCLEPFNAQCMTDDENHMCTVGPLKLYRLIHPSMWRQHLPVSSLILLLYVCGACSSSHFHLQQPTGADRRRCFGSRWRDLSLSPLSQLQSKSNTYIGFSIGVSLHLDFVQWENKFTLCESLSTVIVNPLFKTIIKTQNGGWSSLWLRL